jgi:hypothetical protein
MTIKLNFNSNLALFHLPVLFLAIEMAVSFAFVALNQFLNLSLVCVPMELTVISFAMTVDGWSVRQTVFVHDAGVVMGVMNMINLKVNMHLSSNCLVQCRIWITHSRHFWWNNIAWLLVSAGKCLIKISSTGRIFDALDFIINFNNLVVLLWFIIWIIHGLPITRIWTLHQVIWLQRIVLSGHCSRHGHWLRYHVPIKRLVIFEMITYL